MANAWGVSWGANPVPTGCDYPNPSDVRTGVVYANGTLVGQPVSSGSSGVQGWRGAIIKWFEDDPRGIGLSLLIPSGELYLSEVPDNPVPAMPYAVFKDESELPEYHGAGVKESHTCLFSFVATSLDMAEKIEKALKATYDGALLTLSNGQISGGGQFIEGGKIEKIRHPQRDKTGQWIYKGEFPYKLVVNR